MMPREEVLMKLGGEVVLWSVNNSLIFWQDLALDAVFILPTYLDIQPVCLLDVGGGVRMTASGPKT